MMHMLIHVHFFIMEKYFINRYISILKDGDYLRLTGGKKDLIYYNADEILAVLKSIYDDNLVNDNVEFITEMFDFGYLSKEDTSNFSRGELFFKYLNIDNGFEKLKDSKVLIAGAGGAGGTLIYMLAQYGVKNIYVIDYDIVEYSDVLKTMVYRKEHIGLPKTKALAKILSDNFNIEINYKTEKLEVANNFTSVINDFNPDLVVYAIDPDPEMKLIVNDLLIKRKIPVLFMAYSYEYLMMGPFIIPGVTSCYLSYYNHIINQIDKDFDMKTIKTVNNFNLTHPSTSFNINTIASICMKDCLFYLLDSYEFMLMKNNIIHYNMLTMEGDSTEINCDKFCICQM